MGQANGHLMNWSGCNYKFITIAGQPRNGYETEEDAQAFMESFEKNENTLQAEYSRADYCTGTTIADEYIR